MSEYTDYYGGRRHRSRSRSRSGHDEGVDVVVTAITIQVTVCLILILAFVIYKKADESGYDSFKDEYSSLVRDQGRNGEVMDMLSQAADGVSETVSSFERYLARLLGGFGQGGLQQQDNGTSSAVEIIPGASQPDENNDIEVESAGYGNYNYLEDGVFYTSDGGTGAGGWFPADISGAGEALAPPEGSVFSPLIISAKMKPPVTGMITSAFGYRYHPVTDETDFHSGMDIAAAEGIPILSALPGEVAEVGESRIYGNYIRISHSDNLETFYAHCSEIIAGEGMSIRQGERIAKVGQTGVTTGPHLHFSVLADGLNVDPYWVLKDSIKILEE